MSSKQYLQKRGSTYFAVVEVPKHLRTIIGKPRYIKSLKTDSLTTAARLKLPLVAEWKRQINRAEMGNPDHFAMIREKLVELRNEIDEASDAIQERWGGNDFSDRDLALSDAKDELKALAEDLGLDESVMRPARAFVLVGDTPIRDRLPDWIAETEGKPQTKAQHEFAARQFLKWAGDLTVAEGVNRKKAGEWIGTLLQSGLSRRTVERYVSSLSTFWRWLYKRGHLDCNPGDNPWLGHELGKGKKKTRRRPLPDEVVLKLLRARYDIPGQDKERRYEFVLPDVVRIGLATGMRLGEICELESADVERRDDGYWFNLGEGKTEAAERSVPVHPLIVPIVERRLADGDRYLIANLIRGGVDQRRGHHVSKAFGRFREAAGVTEKGQVFHALRNTFIAMMEGNGVPESTVKLLVGHARGSMTYGHYSNGERVNLRGAINALAYSPQIMALISGTRTCS